jgi:fatty acid desaturase
MDEKQFNKIIGYMVMAIIAYFVLQFIVPYLIYGVIGLVVWRVYLTYQKHK